MIVIMCLIITHIISMFPAFLLGFNVLGWKLGSNDRLGMWCLTPLSTIFQLFRGGQFNLLAEDTGYWRRIPEYPEKTTTYAIIAHHHQHCEVASRSGEVYSIQHYVIKFVSDLRQVGGFPRGTPASFTNKTDRHDITEILLILVINTLTLTS
jgi:hypothetical protein